MDTGQARNLKQQQATDPTTITIAAAKITATGRAPPGRGEYAKTEPDTEPQVPRSREPQEAQTYTAEPKPRPPVSHLAPGERQKRPIQKPQAPGPNDPSDRK